MKARIDIAMGPYWAGIVQAIDVIVAISALGAIGGLPALLNALTKYSRSTIEWFLGRPWRVATTPVDHAACTKV